MQSLVKHFYNIDISNLCVWYFNKRFSCNMAYIGIVWHSNILYAMEQRLLIFASALISCYIRRILYSFFVHYYKYVTILSEYSRICMEILFVCGISALKYCFRFSLHYNVIDMQKYMFFLLFIRK